MGDTQKKMSNFKDDLSHQLKYHLQLKTKGRLKAGLVGLGGS